MKYTIYHPALHAANVTLGALIQQAAALERKITWLVVDRATSENRHGVISDQLVVELTGDRPEVNGWAVLAALVLDAHGQVQIRAVPDYGVPERFLRANAICGHCGTPAPELLVLHNLHTGNCLLIGRGCAAEVLGPNGSKSVQYADVLIVADEAARQAQGRDVDAINANRYAYRLVPYLAQVARQIALYGWVSRKKADRDNIAATSELALDALFAAYDVTPDATATASAEAALTWARQLAQEERDLSDYELKLHELAQKEIISYAETGLAASLLSAHQASAQRALERELTTQPSKPIGQVGERIPIQLTVVDRKEIARPDGVSVLYKFITDDGKRATWFASSDPQLQVGTKYHLKATVVEHGEFQGVIETRLNRCKVLAQDTTQAPLAI